MDGSDLREIADRFRYEVAELVATSRALSSQRDIRKLLALILEKSRQVTGADAGSVYVVEEEGGSQAEYQPEVKRLLHFMLSQNDSVPIDFKELRVEIDASPEEAAEAFGGVQAILALVASQALFATGREPAPPLTDLVAGIRSVFPRVDSPHGRDLGAQAGRLAGVFQAGTVTGRLDFAQPGAVGQPS